MRRATQRTFQPGDHICAVYSGTAELARIGGDFLVQGLKNQERCWYVATGDERSAIVGALRRRRIDVKHEMQRGALDILDGSAAYVVHGEFNPERTVATFSARLRRR